MQHTRIPIMTLVVRGENTTTSVQNQPMSVQTCFMRSSIQLLAKTCGLDAIGFGPTDKLNMPDTLPKTFYGGERLEITRFQN
jgi:hypothetical protein